MASPSSLEFRLHLIYLKELYCIRERDEMRGELDQEYRSRYALKRTGCPLRIIILLRRTL